MSDDYAPNRYLPIKRVTCLATAWFDDDCMPAICILEHGHRGDHRARGMSGNLLAPTWADEAGEEVA